jgi:hypothetical protein
MNRWFHRPAPHEMQRTKASNPVLWIGVNVLLFGTGPLITICLAAAIGLTTDPNPHPVGLSLLALFTFWPGVGLILAGALRGVRRRRVAHS